MIKAIQDSQRVMEQCSYYLLHPQQVREDGHPILCSRTCI